MKKNVAVVAGGDSGEYEISIRSGEVVMRHLDPEKFRLFRVVVRGGQWTCTDLSGKSYQVELDRFTMNSGNEKVKIDAVFNAIHGTPGEDGKLQGYLDLVGVPYTSCDQATSALTFDKYLCNGFVRSLGIRTAPSLVLHSKDQVSKEEIIAKLGMPVFIKPNRGGSSVGTSRVNEVEQLLPALETAFREDGQVLVEAFIPGREITCGVITRNGKILSLPITEIVSQKEFFDYEAKYQGKSNEITPAAIPDSIETTCRRQSELLYRELNCKGMVRIDYIFNDEGLFFLEVNTVPGLSEASIVPQQAAVAGISLDELFNEAVENALGNP